MGSEHEPDVVWRAQELYCVDRLSYAKVAEATGVSATTLKAWGAKFGWAQKRESIAQAESDIRVHTITARKRALEQLLEADGPKEASQMAFAVASLERLALAQQELIASGKLAAPAAPHAITGRAVTTFGSRADAIHALRSAVEQKLGCALADPASITSAAVQDIKRCLDLVSELEASLPKESEPEEAKQRGISEGMVESIYRALGITEGA